MTAVRGLRVAVFAAFACGAVFGVFATDETVVRVPAGGDVAAVLADIRSQRAAGSLPANGRVRIVCADGRYMLSQAIVFGPDDSNVTLAAEKGACPVFTGGRILPPFSDGGNGLWKATVPTGTRFEQLWVNGERAVRARSPNRFYYHVQETVDRGVSPETGKVEDLSYRAFYARPEDVAPLASLSPVEQSRVVIRHYHSWEAAQARPVRIDAQTGLVVETPVNPWRLNAWPEKKPRYVLENFRAALDSPGEWFLDVDTSVLWYKPRPGERLKTTRAIAPVLAQLLVVQGDRATNRPVHDVCIDGLSFVYAAYNLPEKGQGSLQAVTDVPSAVEMRDAENIVLSHCRIAKTGGHGIHFASGTRDADLRFSAVRDLGAGAVRIGEECAAGVCRITVADCILQGGGRIFPGAVGVWSGMASEVSIVHNDIGDFLYSGISLGWSWGYDETGIRDNLVEGNHIHHIGQGVLSDLGGIYTLGLMPGTRVVGNRIHDVYSYDHTGYGGYGLYADEGSTGIIFESNLVYRVKTGAVHQHYGRDNVFRNNILAGSTRDMVVRSRAERHHSLTFDHNIVYWENGSRAWRGGGELQDVSASSNVYWCSAGKSADAFLGRSFDDWQKAGMDAGSSWTDPQFVNPESGDFRLHSSSKALTCGFVPFDIGKAGVRGDASWRKLADACDPGEVHFAPEPEELLTESPSFSCGFEEQNDCLDVVVEADKTAKVQLTAEEARTGKGSLEICDSPTLAAPYQPHLCRNVGASRGVVTIAFSARVGSGADVSFFLRDYHPQTGAEYVDGPSLRIRPMLAEGGDMSVSLQANAWHEFEMTVDFDQQTWRLAVRCAGKLLGSTDGLSFPKGFGRMDWMGWTTDSSCTARWWLDDLKFSREGASDRASASRPSPLAVWKAGERDVAIYRIPALCTAPNGDLVAVCDARTWQGGDLDSGQPINVVVRRSSDGGRSWTPSSLAWKWPWRGDSKWAASDPSMIVDRVAKKIFLFSNVWDWTKLKDGDVQGGVYRFFVQESSDNGATWSKPREISRDIAVSQWPCGKTRGEGGFIFISSGSGCQLADGTLLHTLVHVDDGVALFGSPDHGKTWRAYGQPAKGGDECKVVELADGSLMVNARWRNGARLIHRSVDRGRTWTSVPDEGLVDPVCNAQLKRLGEELFFSNCNSATARENLSLRISTDDGKSWRAPVLVAGGSCGYSDFAELPNGDVGVLYECRECTAIDFAVIRRESLK